MEVSSQKSGAVEKPRDGRGENQREPIAKWAKMLDKKGRKV
jgi:hypothetical protein